MCINSNQLLFCTTKFDNICFNHIAECIQIRSKCNWYEHGEILSESFVNLEKQLSLQNTTKTLIINHTEATDQICILDHMKDFYETFFG